MTPADHYREAEKCLQRSGAAEYGSHQESLMLRVAQVHATLATAPVWFGDEPPAPTGEVTHKCPETGGAVTPCCGRTPFELPRTDRLAIDDTLVTCKGGGS